jgi:hypothetical protein
MNDVVAPRRPYLVFRGTEGTRETVASAVAPSSARVPERSKKSVPLVPQEVQSLGNASRAKKRNNEAEFSAAFPAFPKFPAFSNVVHVVIDERRAVRAPIPVSPGVTITDPELCARVDLARLETLACLYGETVGDARGERIVAERISAAIERLELCGVRVHMEAVQ